MGIREKMNENPGLTTGATVAVVLLAIAFIVYQITGFGGQSYAGGGGKAWFSDDDGKTVFADDAIKRAPFDHDGKQAVKAYCFTNDSGKTHWIGYLERYTPDAKAKLDREDKIPPEKRDSSVMETVGAIGIEVKRPGDPNWVTQKDTLKWSKIISPTPPSGTKAQPIEIFSP